MSKKLCKLVSDGFLDDHTKKYTQMVNEPKYVCMKCGRAANDESSLCRPKKMKDKDPDKKMSKKEAKKIVEKSEGYRQISEDLANENSKKFDEKIQKRIVKISKDALRKKQPKSLEEQLKQELSDTDDQANVETDESETTE
jgi:hypothetical protein